MQTGSRNRPVGDQAGEITRNPSPLSMIVLYDRPVVFERARQLLAGLSRTMEASRILQLEAWQFDSLQQEAPVSRLRKAMRNAEMIVVAANAVKPLPELVEIEIRLWLELTMSSHRAMFAFLEGASPEARRPGLPFDRLQTVANVHEADFFVHIGDPAPLAAWPCLPSENEAGFQR
jgi:hypothetical protein